ncbi:hypothetical protein [Natronoglomus mannanivorans]|uniref:Uncharacterized protein n=1 Tax=Natronoglomus mannanivorans TaxID=2979990 RepID=A0AAP2Z5K7_9EURY|nr:hypothetical protein [Halobacteria archaeon AArc-xg1-1]
MTWSRSRRLSVAVVVTCLLVGAVAFAAPVTGVDGAVATSSAQDNSDPAAPFEVETERHPDPDTNLITVRMTIEPEDAALVDLELETDRQRESMLVPNSYTTTVSPSNNAVGVESIGDDEFHVEELRPGERVVIEFQAVPMVSDRDELEVADISVEYTHHGQRLSTDFVATGDTTEPDPTPEASLPIPLLAGASALTLVFGFVIGTIAFGSNETVLDRREEWVGTLEDIEHRVEDPLVASRLQRLRERMSADERSAQSARPDDASQLEDGDDDTPRTLVGTILATVGRTGSSSDRTDDSTDEGPDIEL